MKRGVNQKGRKSPYHSHYETKKLLLIYILTIKFERGKKKVNPANPLKKKCVKKQRRKLERSTKLSWEQVEPERRAKTNLIWILDSMSCRGNES